MSFGAWRNSRIFSCVFCYRSLVLYVCLVNRCLSCCTFSFGHCVVCSSDSDYLYFYETNHNIIYRWRRKWLLLGADRPFSWYGHQRDLLLFIFDQMFWLSKQEKLCNFITLFRILFFN
jgi:hypothetical protein